MHGAGVIDRIETAKINGVSQEYYVFRMPAGGLVLKIPVAASDVVGLRCVVNAEEALQLLDELPELEMDQCSGSWNQRYRENLGKVKSGDLYEVAKVIKSLLRRDNQRGLSTGERKLLRAAKQILISELVLAIELDYQQIEGRIQQVVSGGLSEC